MSENSGRLLGLYDELSAFLAQINLYHGRGLSDSREFTIVQWTSVEKGYW